MQRHKHPLATTAWGVLFATTSNSKDNGDALINNPQDLQQALCDGGQRIQKKYYKKKPVLDATLYAKLQAIAKMENHEMPTLIATNTNSVQEDKEEEEVIYLDGEENLRSSQMMKAVGSLSFCQPVHAQ
jgi:hypothetical protein